MAKEKNILDPEIIIPKVSDFRKRMMEFLTQRKKLFTFLMIVVVILAAVGLGRNRRNSPGTSSAKVITAKVEKGFDFPALNNQGKIVSNKIKFKITNVEKTNQVIVKDQTYTAKNNKLFLIVNLELKNGASQAYNILPGDLIRLVYNNDEENKFAPDLHNNLIQVAAISTKIDRVGFIIPQEARDFKLYIGELEGKKETVLVAFPS